MKTFLITWVADWSNPRYDQSVYLYLDEKLGTFIVEAENENEALKKLIVSPDETMTHWLFNILIIGNEESIKSEDEAINSKLDELSILFNNKDLGQYDPDLEEHVEFMKDHVEEILEIVKALKDEDLYLRIEEIN